jgi:phosphoribosylamine--glycine ligase
MTETVLLVGGGGREHAIAHAVADSSASTLYACASNTNPGIQALCTGYQVLDETDAQAVVTYARSIDATLAVIGPESALQAGVADALDQAGIYAFGPQATEARIETDKLFQREFMQAEGIPGCPTFETFDSADTTATYLGSITQDVAVKPRGLTGGKGVRVTGDQVTHEEAVAYVRESGHEEWVVEERLVGEEFTIQAFVANGSVRVSPAVQDHKRAYEGDVGPNTGGMGSYSDAHFELPFMSSEEYDAAVKIIEATAESLDEYKGMLYGQFMLTSDGPKVVEFNARFGDPEAMNTLPVLESDFVAMLSMARDGNALPELTFAAQATVCKYAVPDGYPTDPNDGATVQIDEKGAESVGARLFYASVDAQPDGIFTTTSRSFAVVGIADTIGEAEALAEKALTEADQEGLRIRHDIGTDALLQRRIDHMQDLRSQ